MYMNAQEAIVNLKYVTERWANDEDMYSETMEIEIDQEFINTLYTAKEALDKQVGKKPNMITENEIGYYECPNCKKKIGTNIIVYQSNYCQYCGQKLDWQ